MLTAEIAPFLIPHPPPAWFLGYTCKLNALIVLRIRLTWRVVPVGKFGFWLYAACL